jgi:hypothetical protein
MMPVLPDQWYRSYGNEMWGFDGHGLMACRYARINDTRAHERRECGPGVEREDALATR